MAAQLPQLQPLRPEPLHSKPDRPAEHPPADRHAERTGGASEANAAAPDRLGELRSRLDKVDASLHRLLRERFEIVAEIGTTKGANEPIIRPAREAAVLENRLSLHTGPMPVEALVHIYRALIGGACATQRAFTVHVAGTHEAARFLYGPIDTLAHQSAEAAVEALADAPSDVAVIDAAAHARWWDSLDPAHVFARCQTSDGGAILVLGGALVARGTGPLALVLRPDADGPQVKRVTELDEDDAVLGRFHPFPVPIPVAR